MTARTPDVAEAPSPRTTATPCDTDASGASGGGGLASRMDLAGSTFAACRSRGYAVPGGIEAMRSRRMSSMGGTSEPSGGGGRKPWSGGRRRRAFPRPNGPSPTLRTTRA